ncbi:MAG: META domain-containing protein [Candidatus Electrothrix sp. GM3_4]|nr:META domain-containing protein [Candidatus Electrothrix sp. GM3_4]
MTPKNFVVILTIFASLMLTGCAFNQPDGVTDQSQELRETSWNVSGYDNGQGTIMRINNSGQKMTAIFGANGRVSGSSGCNSYSGDYTYSAADQTLQLGRLMISAMLCMDENIMQQEGHFITALQTGNSYHITGNTLTLKAADGGTAVIFIRQ